MSLDKAKLPRWMTIGEASQFLGVSPSTLRAWAQSGKLRAYRTVGNHRRFKTEDMVDFLKKSVR